MVTLRDIRVGRSRYRLGGLALYLSGLSSVRMKRAKVMAWLKQHVAEQQHFHGGRIIWSWDAFMVPRRYLVSDVDASFAGKFPFSCPICGDDVKTARHRHECFYDCGVCERCYVVSKPQLFEIAGIKECDRLRLALQDGRYTEASKEAIHMQTTAELRDTLISDLEGLRKGAITRPEARCRAYVAKQIIDTVKVECVAMAQGYDRTVPLSIRSTQPTAIAAE